MPRPPLPVLASPRRRALAALCLASAVAACGGSGDDEPPAGGLFIEGTLDGLGSGKSVTLRNNGGDDLVLRADGVFRFAQTLAPGAAYAVTVAVPPEGQTCSVTHGSGTAARHVDDVEVRCAAPGGGTGPSSGLPALVGDWELPHCVPFSPTTAGRTAIRITASGDDRFVWSQVLAQYGNTTCTGSSTLLPATKMGDVQITAIQTGNGVAAHWSRVNTITGTTSHIVWTKVGEAMLCPVGDVSPTMFPGTAAVLAATRQMQASCYAKRP